MDRNTDRKWQGRSRGGKFGNAVFVCIIRIFGVRCAYVLLSFVAMYFIPFAPKATCSIWLYYRKIIGYGVIRSLFELYMHYFTFGQTLIDKIAVRSGRHDSFRFEFENYDRFLDTISSGGGVVMLGAHVGCWEVGSVYFGRYGRKLNIVMFDGEDPKVREVLEEGVKEADYKVIPVNHGVLEAMLKIKNALDAGEYVCFNGDRYTDISTAVKEKFLGAEALFPAGPFRIAGKCKVPVVVYYAVREKGRRYRFIFEELTSGKTGHEELMNAYIASLEEVVRKYPRQWFNFYNFWNI